MVTLYYAAEMTEPKIVEFLENMGIMISAGQVSNLLIKNQDNWHAEKEAVYLAGLQSTSWQHVDDTATRVNGENQHCHIICNPLYSAYFTRPRKDRLTVIDILANRFETQFLLNEQTVAWLQTFGTPQWAQAAIARWPQGTVLSLSRTGGPGADRIRSSQRPATGQGLRSCGLDCLSQPKRDTDCASAAQ